MSEELTLKPNSPTDDYKLYVHYKNYQKTLGNNQSKQNVGKEIKHLLFFLKTWSVTIRVVAATTKTGK